MSQITTVIFDMYETLVEEDQDQWGETFKEIIRHQNLNVDAESLSTAWWGEMARFRESRADPNSPFQSYFEGWRDTFAGAFDQLGITGDAGAATLKSFQDISQRPPFEETQHALGLIQSRCTTAILSNADDGYFRPNLRLLGDEIVAALSAALTSEEARCYKPHPGFFQEMLRRLEVSPEECLYVGDRQFEDVKGARGVGMGTVWINRAGKPMDPQLPSPDYEINNLLEIPEILNRIAGLEDGASESQT